MTNYDYLYDKSNYSQYIEDQNHFVDKKLSYVIVEKGYVLPTKIISYMGYGGVLSQNGEFIEGSDLYRSYGGKYEFSKDEVTVKDEKVIYIGMMVDAWGHCITDCLKHLWFLFTDEYSEKYRDYKLIYVAGENYKFSDSFKELLEILGIDHERFIKVDRISQFTEILVPDESFFRHRNFTREYSDTIEKIREYGLSNRKELNYDKVYYSYADCGRYKQVGEYKLENYFMSKGYKIIYPEKLTFKEQLNVLTNCNEFASTIGSSSHNVVFLRDNVKIILIPRTWYVNVYQLTLDHIHSQKVYYIDSSLSVMIDRRKPNEGPFFYCISENLLKYFGDDPKQNRSFWKRNMKDFRKYLRLGLVHNYKGEYAACDCYAKEAEKYYSYYLDNNSLFYLVKKCRIIDVILLINLKYRQIKRFIQGKWS
ncbi:MAG: glycosyltransferase family 61 protein [Lachnospiraceae bacterium]|nr:glycosyltransferase family 61 protein [Lachnospiraceae bacterium]